MRSKRHSHGFAPLLLSALFALVSSQAGPWDAAFYKFPEALVTEFGAACLDGSTPGVYVRPGAATNKWKIHIQGGGWCTSDSDCATRAKTVLGSSKNFTPWLSEYWRPVGAGFYGLMDANATNPFGDWNFAWFPYCDGSSFTGNVATPVLYNGTSLYFRGAANLDATLALLESNFGFLSRSDEVIVSGTSAGGLATYYHSGYIKSMLKKPTARLVAAPDAGFFIDHANRMGQYQWRSSLTSSAKLWNATLRGAGAACLGAHSPADQWQCLFPENLYPYQKAVDGIWLLNSLYDTAQMGYILGLGCNLPTTCNATRVAEVQQYASDLKGTVEAAQSSFANRDGRFLTSCYQHEESCRPFDWYGITINGFTPNSSFAAWYYGGPTGAVLEDVAWPGDGSCVVGGHGYC